MTGANPPGAVRGVAAGGRRGALALNGPHSWLRIAAQMRAGVTAGASTAPQAALQASSRAARVLRQRAGVAAERSAERNARAGKDRREGAARRAAAAKPAGAQRGAAQHAHTCRTLYTTAPTAAAGV
jgi:hypothetical protein